VLWATVAVRIADDGETRRDYVARKYLPVGYVIKYPLDKRFLFVDGEAGRCSARLREPARLLRWKRQTNRGGQDVKQSILITALAMQIGG
jgi:hypothetical protein